MVSERFKRFRKGARRKIKRDPRRSLLVVSEGEVTEPEYIQGFVRWKRSAIVRVEIAKEHGVPLSLVKSAKKLMLANALRAKREHDIFLKFDEVWCIFDRDDHPGFTDAIQMARDNGIRIAISNPSSELWILLHFKDNPGVQHRDQITRMLKGFIAGYDKHVDIDLLKDGYENAVNISKRICREAIEEEEFYRNPTTYFMCLTCSILHGAPNEDWCSVCVNKWPPPSM